MSDSITFNLALVAAILSSAFASGGIISLSFLTVPALLLPVAGSSSSSSSSSRTPATPISHITHQWLHLYNRGKRIYPSLAATSALAFSYVAYTLRSRPDKLARMYVAAAAVTMAIVPFTLGVMMPTNRRIEARAKRDVLPVTPEREREKKEETPLVSEEDKAKRTKEDHDMPGLMIKWAWLNAIRGVFPLMGAAIGATAALC